MDCINSPLSETTNYERDVIIIANTTSLMIRCNGAWIDHKNNVQPIISGGETFFKICI